MVLNSRGETIKLLAITTMLIDHIGYVFFGDIELFRIIGRLAFPLFAYQLTVGFIHTSNIRKYLSRILIFAFLSIVPYGLIFNWTKLNILFTLALALLILHIVENLNLRIGYCLILTPLFLPMEYGIYGIVLILALYYMRKNLSASVLIIVIATLFYSLFFEIYIQLFSLFGVLIVLLDWEIGIKIKLFKLKVNKWLFYIFYPSHLLIIYAIYIIYPIISE